MWPVVSAVARRRTAVMATRKVQQRGMGGHAPKPEWTGIDKTVRSYVPEDYQLAGAILTGYGSLIALAVIRSSMKKAPEVVEAAPAPAAAPSTSTGVPSVESPDFDAFVESDAFVKLMESEEELAALTAKM